MRDASSLQRTDPGGPGDYDVWLCARHGEMLCLRFWRLQPWTFRFRFGLGFVWFGFVLFEFILFGGVWIYGTCAELTVGAYLIFYFLLPEPQTEGGGVALTLRFRRNFNPGFCGAMKSQGDRAGARMGTGGSDSNIIYFILALRISREVLEYSYLYMVLVPVLDGGGVRGTGVILYSRVATEWMPNKLLR